MKTILLLLALAFPVAVTATDEATVASPNARVSARAMATITAPGNCAMTETAAVSVNFNTIEKDGAQAANLFESKKKEIEAIARQLKLEKLDVQSVNYSLYPYNPGTMGAEIQWQMNGSLSFLIVPPAKAKDLLALLVKKGFQPSLNVSAYKNGNCSNDNGDYTFDERN